MTTYNADMQQRIDTAANWTSNAPTLRSGELGIESDTGRIKVGDGSTAWGSLAYLDVTWAALTNTLTNKTIDSASNTLTVDLSEATVTGTTAEFRTAISDGSFPNVTSGAGVPASTPGAVGDVYVDTTNDNVYIATDTASSADWDQATGAGGGGLSNVVEDTTPQLGGNLDLNDFGATVQLTNDNAGTINKGQPVYIKSNGNIDLADADAASTADTTIGLVADATIATTATGAICTYGVVDGFDTSGLTAGALVYVATGAAGGLTTTQPTGSAIIKPIGFCLESHATTGRVLVFPQAWSASPLADGSSMKDDSGNEVLQFNVVASAVNHVEVGNNSTGNGATVSAIGGDTNIDLVLAAKGTGVVKGHQESFSFALSDETTDLTTGTAKLTWRVPYAFTITDVRASVNTAPVGSTIIVDINDGGTSIMTTNKLSIDASEKTSTTAATAPGVTDSALADDAEVTFDIDQVGSTTAGKGLKVTIIGYQT